MKKNIIKGILFVLLVFLLVSYSKSSFKRESDIIYNLLRSKYAGFSDMKKKGLSKKIWNTAKSFDEITTLFDTYMNDTHFYIETQSGYKYKQYQKFDEGTVKSSDPERTCVIKETSNTYYIRYNLCDIFWEEYIKLPSLAEKAKFKENIVLDFRSNQGGGNGQQIDFFENLVKAEYKGTIYVLQDNWSYSAGEVWGIASRFSNLLTLKLVGTHSGGSQIYGNCEKFQKDGVFMYIPTTSFASYIPKNYLGEGLGYEPEVWATTQNMKQVLENLGMNLEDIEFK